MSKSKGEKSGRPKDKPVEKTGVGITIVLLSILVVVILLISLFYLNPNNNILKDPGFEENSSEWVYLHWSPAWEPFTISTTQSRSGDKSAFLRLRGDDSSQDTKIVGVVQDVYPEQMPRKLKGYYFVQNWVRGADLQYIQCAVMAFDVPGYDDAPLQIRYILSGVDSEPFYLDNAKYIIITGNQPGQAEWIKFERDLHEDFSNSWGFIPDFSMIRVVFEVRYDSIPFTDSAADVYFDDVYLGS